MKLKRPIFLISGTVLGTVGVLSYVPTSPSKGSLLSLPAAAQASSTTTQTAPSTSAATNTPATTPTTDATTPAPKKTTKKKTTTSAKHKTASQTQTPTQTPVATQTPTPTPTPVKTNTSSGTRTIAGSTVNTPFGPVQVQITVQGTKITDATALQTPRGGRSSWINQQAVPYLVQETLAAQSANIQGVGGATYTSEAWAQSLQSALSKI